MKRHPRRAVTAVLAGLATAALLAGCGGGNGGPSGNSGGEPVEGGTLVYRAAGSGRSNDPATITGYGQLVPLRGLVDSLVWNNYDGTFAPWLATQWTVNDDATRYEFTLRDDVTFSNGEKLDASAVKLSFDALRAGGAKFAVVNGWIGDLKEITAPEPTKVVFDFNTPNSSFLQAVSTASLGIVAPQTSKLSFDDRQDGTGIVGSGAFTVSESRGEEGYTLTRRDDYAWAPEPAENKGAAHLEAIKVITIADNSIAAAELRSGGLDLLHNTEPADKTDFSKSDQITIRREPLPGSALGLVTNTDKPGLDDVNVRKALALATDRKAVLQRASAIDIPPTSVLTASNPYYTDQSELIVADLAKAEQLLDDAGWLPGKDGIREKDGNRLSFDLIYSTSTVSHEPNIAVVQAQWKKLGVQLTFGALTPAELNQRTQSGDYSFAWASGTRPDPDVLRQNYGGLDPELDAIFGRIKATPDIAERQKLAADASKIVLEKAYYIPFYDFIQPLAYRNTTHLPLFEASHIPWFGDVWLDKK